MPLLSPEVFNGVNCNRRQLLLARYPEIESGQKSTRTSVPSLSKPKKRQMNETQNKVFPSQGNLLSKSSKEKENVVLKNEENKCFHKTIFEASKADVG